MRLARVALVAPGVEANLDGLTAELPVAEWEEYDPEPLTPDEFEKVWDSARRQIEARPS